jgi:predicted acetyltransferase
VTIFSQRPGRWQVAVARKNTAAGEFWRKTIAGSAAATGVQEHDVANDDWNGPVFRFGWLVG